MHEWALAESVLEAVKQELAGKELGAVTRVTLSLGELQNIDKTIFTEGLSSLAGEYGMSGDVFTIEHDPARLQCNHCARRWSLRETEDVGEDELEAIHFLPETAHLFISCPDCGSRDFRIEHGRGVAITGISADSDTKRGEAPAREEIATEEADAEQAAREETAND